MRIPRVGTGLTASWRAGYRLTDLRHDVLAGLTVGIVAIPLAMALAIATGVPPQHGLYTAIVAGAVIALTGGSRFNVSGPTAAFVVILFPVVQEYGLGGLLLATIMAGLILVSLGAARLGVLIQYVPYPVVLGFTAGIAVVITVLQIPDFLGLATEELGEHFVDNLWRITVALPGISVAELAVGTVTLATLILWPRFRLAIPAPLVGLFVGALAAALINHWPSDVLPDVATIASRFTWEAHGSSGSGIPPVAPELAAPWRFPGPDGAPLDIDFSLIRALLGPAFAIAVLAAIESLLCAVVADGLTRTRHDPNAELIGQGLGNMVVPFFGGITATAAIARTATNIRSGARSPVAAVVHSLVVLLGVVGLAGVLGLVPMAALAALLFVVAWNMSEARHFAHTLRSAPPGDVAILVICFGLTVLFDMVLAVAVGVGLAAALFIRRMALLTESERMDPQDNAVIRDLPRHVAVYDVNGPLFFGAAEKAVASLRLVDPEVRTIIVDMHDVPSMDGTAIVALQSLIDEMHGQGVSLILVGLPARIIVKLRRAGIRKTPGSLTYCRTLGRASMTALRWDGQYSRTSGSRLA
ncbi:C4-dicarboxylic acid transporter DauA [Aquisalimonas asiatica]|uniref:Sulfate permease, SulP family n=1 Tax=Aquisalimonas asiatica TaxID=406100 RepID=A0A1H8RMW9_9GAMM|nr:C4-dicarboxylic acid transporter DauA [Aquisalimonas asiatica]SEO67720.1 sulfate permease, SulP family [Aquisalimonas asiatica]